MEERIPEVQYNNKDDVRMIITIIVMNVIFFSNEEKEAKINLTNWLKRKKGSGKQSLILRKQNK